MAAIELVTDGDTREPAAALAAAAVSGALRPRASRGRGITWLVLTLGAQLFELVKLAFLTKLMRESWFAIPVTAFAFACAMHLTDVRPAIVRGIRSLLLVLLSWLLPVAVLLIGGFLATLPFTGVLKDRLRIGFGGYLPPTTALRVIARPPDEPRRVAPRPDRRRRSSWHRRSGRPGPRIAPRRRHRSRAPTSPPRPAPRTARHRRP